MNEKADKSHDCDEETKGGEEIQASDLADTCEEQGGHNHPGVGDTLQVTLCSTMQHTAALHLTWGQLADITSLSQQPQACKQKYLWV